MRNGTDVSDVYFSTFSWCSATKSATSSVRRVLSQHLCSSLRSHLMLLFFISDNGAQRSTTSLVNDDISNVPATFQQPLRTYALGACPPRVSSNGGFFMSATCSGFGGAHGVPPRLALRYCTGSCVSACFREAFRSIFAVARANSALYWLPMFACS